jgi:hypothetical protein
MALTAETIKSNEGLAGLTETQIAAIETLSVNDEERVVGQRIGRLHQQYDKDIFEITGIEKASDTEKSYEYNKRVLSGYKDQVEGAPAQAKQVADLKAKVVAFEKQIAEGSTDKALIQKLKDAEGKITQISGELTTSRANLLEKDEAFKGQLMGLKVNGAFDVASKGLKFKEAYAKEDQNTLLEAAKMKILAVNKPDVIEENGKEVLVFRDAQGEILRTKENGLNITTMTELLKASLTTSLTDEVNQSGAGSKKPTDGSVQPSIIELSSAKTQVVADEIIMTHLMSQGVLRGSTAFTEQQQELRSKNKIQDLPVK